MGGRNLERGLVLVSFRVDGKRTSVSLDELLFDYLAQRLDGPEAARQWIAHEAELLYAIEGGEDVRSGVSRLVQRRVLRFLLDPQTNGAVPSEVVTSPEPTGTGSEDGSFEPVPAEPAQSLTNPDPAAM
jgi:hypothetical protein